MKRENYIMLFMLLVILGLIGLLIFGLAGILAGPIFWGIYYGVGFLFLIWASSKAEQLGAMLDQHIANKKAEKEEEAEKEAAEKEDK